MPRPSSVRRRVPLRKIKRRGRPTLSDPCKAARFALGHSTAVLWSRCRWSLPQKAARSTPFRTAARGPVGGARAKPRGAPPRRPRFLRANAAVRLREQLRPASAHKLRRWALFPVDCAPPAAPGAGRRSPQAALVSAANTDGRDLPAPPCRFFLGQRRGGSVAMRGCAQDSLCAPDGVRVSDCPMPASCLSLMTNSLSNHLSNTL